VVFLDSDDTLVPGALTRVAAIQRTTEADLILFDYARAFPKGRTRRPSHTIVETLDGQVVTLAEHPELLAVLNVAWTKAYRRAFLDRVGTSFPAGYYEDIPWTYLLLAEAEGIRIMDQVVVLYRQQREGRILATPSDRHLDLLTQYERLFTELQRRGHSHYMTAMFDRMVEHSTFVLAQGTKRLSRQSQELFFANLTVLYNEWKPSELKIGPGLRRMRYAVVERGGRYRPVYRLLFLFRPLRVFKATFRSLTSAVAKLGKRPSIASPDIS
jgi:CRISPR system Cascade subunit CasB